MGMEYFGHQSRKGEPSFRNDQILLMWVQSTETLNLVFWFELLGVVLIVWLVEETI